ncbi:MAG TPA: DUF6395 domain-containing protein [Tenuifilaceae bacterium]|nr:DUF6395 domain-containing protein [Tenuifilaceae bacterium]HQC66235.1 DUF6395 domain-containing protein [Tenuifilaceae bacterium]
MRVNVSQRGRELKFFFEFEDDDAMVISREDRSNYGKPTFKSALRPEDVTNDHKFFAVNNQECKFLMPRFFKVENLHPDVLALASLFLVFPFVKRRIEFPFKVSPYFAEQIQIITGLLVEPIDKNLLKRQVDPSYKPALLYSGGVDSTAAIALLPDDTPLVYSKRIVSADDPKSKTYSSDSAELACRVLAKNGKCVYIVENDMEYLLRPTSLTTHQAISVPALLLADYLKIDCLAFGTVMEAAYRTGSGSFVDVAIRSFFHNLKFLYNAVEIAYHPLTIGMSEVCTTILCESTGFAHIAESCTRAKGGKPCMSCIKCFRKGLLNMAIKGDFASDVVIDKFFTLPLVKKVLLSDDIKLENIYAYICSKYEGQSIFMNKFKERVLPEGRKVDWLNRWYAPSLDHLAEKYREYCKEKAELILQPMSKDDVEAMHSFFSIKVPSKNIEEFQNLLRQTTPTDKMIESIRSKKIIYKIDDSYHFKNEYLELITTENHDLSFNITVDILIKIHDYPEDWVGIVSKFENDNNNEFSLRLRDQNNGRWHFFDGEKNVSLSWSPLSILPLNKWCRITVVRDFNEQVLKIYANEVLVGEKNMPNSKKAKQVKGNIVLLSQKNRTLEASLASVSIWNRALNINEIQEVRVGNNIIDSKGIIGHWKFSHTQKIAVNNVDNNSFKAIFRKL